MWHDSMGMQVAFYLHVFGMLLSCGGTCWDLLAPKTYDWSTLLLVVGFCVGVWLVLPPQYIEFRMVVVMFKICFKRE